MKHSVGLAACMIAIALVFLPSSQATGVAVGAGQATFGFCPYLSDNMAVAAVETAPGVWQFVVGDENHVVSAGGCAIVGATGFSGPFNPAGVGFPPQCLAGLLLFEVLCLGNPNVDGVTVTYPVPLMCTTLTGCVSGTMSLVYEYV